MHRYCRASKTTSKELKEITHAEEVSAITTGNPKSKNVQIKAENPAKFSAQRKTNHCHRLNVSSVTKLIPEKRNSVQHGSAGTMTVAE